MLRITKEHRSIEYEFFGESEALLRHGASGTLENASGHRAITGLDGTKIKSDGWDSPLRLLKAAETKEAMEEALNALETVGDGYVEKVALVQTGLKKKREFPDIWDNDRFTKILKKPDSWFLKKDTKADEGEEKAAVRMLMEDGDGEQPAAKEE
ncbi:unnamed protein product [Amoebophrya sp. A25]|nr:unnamed protein product [Amoebophrya sp. A25]|eukprot:GSA25T00008901001.1